MDVAVSFLERFSDGEFDTADELIHSERPLERAADFTMLSSLLFTDFLATFLLGAIPTEVTETTVIEEGPTTAIIDATLDVAGVWTIDGRIELRPRGSDEQSFGDGRRARWAVWNVDLKTEGDNSASTSTRLACGLNAVDDRTPAKHNQQYLLPDLTDRNGHTKTEHAEQDVPTCPG